jgi:hypothetical protein
MDISLAGLEVKPDFLEAVDFTMHPNSLYK